MSGLSCWPNELASRRKSTQVRKNKTCVRTYVQRVGLHTFFHDTIHDTLRYIAKQAYPSPRVLLVGSKSVQLTSLVGSTHAFVMSAILKIALNTSPHVRESMKILDSQSRPLDSGFQLSGFRNPYHSGFRIPNHCGFRIPTAKICWIPDSLTWGETLLSKKSVNLTHCDQCVDLRWTSTLVNNC